MGELVMKAARELGIAAHVSVKEDAFVNPLVTVAYPPKAIQSRIPATLLMEESLVQIKVILGDMAKMAQRQLKRAF
jgi:hypothetical protein